jgi:hypothetical protein
LDALVLIGGAKIVREEVWLFNVVDDTINELVEVTVETPEEVGNAEEELRNEDDEAITMLWTDV